MNKVLLIGRLTRDADLSQSGSTYAKFTLAVNRQFKDKDGSKKADFINCVAFGKTAEVLAQYTQKGSQIGVEGSLQVSNYKDKDGAIKYSTQVVVESIEFLGSKQDNQEQETNQQVNQQSTYKSPQAPINQNQKPQYQQTTKTTDIYQEIDNQFVTDDDLPF